MRRKTVWLCAAALGAIIALACAESASAADTFAWNLFREAVHENPRQNGIVSPTGAFSMIGTLLLGSDGVTRDEIRGVLEWNETDDAMADLLAVRRAAVGSDGNDGTLWTSQTAVWTQMGIELFPEFRDRIGSRAGIFLAAVDFQRESEKALATVNEWFAEHLGEKLKSGTEAFSPDTRLALANATAFKGVWKTPFNVEATRNEYFTDIDGSDSKIAMMRKRETVPFVKTDRFRWISLPYDDDRFTMEFVLPSETIPFDLFEAGLTAEMIDSVRNQATPTETEIFIPRFDFTADYSLDAPLVRLGMTSAFGSTADFSRMAMGQDLFVSTMTQKISVAVNEKGAEASAATAATLGVKTAIPDTAERFCADTPFLFLIRDRQTDEAVFIGRFVRAPQPDAEPDAGEGGAIE